MATTLTAGTPAPELTLPSLDGESVSLTEQIWAARYPERFHPTIDWDWQKRQLAEERADEVARGICGPNGCPLPPLA